LIAKANLENRSGEDYCLGPGKFKGQKMIDFVSKAANILT
jgi:hypothetical protein